MDKYQDYGRTEMNGQAAQGRAAMRCAGCGGKVGSTVLSRVLRRLEIPHSEHVLVGLETPDDAAIVQLPGGRPVVVTTDFFASPLEDAYAAGRIAALNAASDAFTFGARPAAALAIATIPVGDTHRQEELLYELLAGGLEEFRRMGAALVGGHTIEGPQLTIGYTVLADPGDRPNRARGELRERDRLILTKPLGSGVLLAAQMRAECRAAWMEELLRTMLASNQTAAELIDEFDISAATDVTGFGLAGHALQLAGIRGHRPPVGEPESVSSQEAGGRGQGAGFRNPDPPVCLNLEIAIHSIPLLSGAAELLSEGVESTLAPSNRAAEAEIESSGAQRRTPQYAALFDPQTSGGLLLAVSQRDVEPLMLRLAEMSDIPAAVIGRVTAASQTRPIRLVDQLLSSHPELCTR
jgi:selenide,water dikinase